MLYRKFGRTEWQVSAVALGTWNLGNQWGEMTDAQAEALIQSALDQGMNLFDVADSYGIPHGLSELRLGKALKGRRENVHIVSKCGHFGKRTGQGVPFTTPDMVRLCGHAVLGRLRTDYLDVLLCHEGNIKDPSNYIEGFEALKSEGFLREYGISSDNLEVVQRFNDMSGGNCAVVELNYSLINVKAEAELLPYCRENDIAVLVRGPLAKGLLSGRFDLDTVFTDQVRKSWNKGESKRDEYERMIARVDRIKSEVDDEDLAQAAIRYVISHEAKAFAIPGATKVSQIEANARAGAAELTPDLWGRLSGIE